MTDIKITTDFSYNLEHSNFSDTAIFTSSASHCNDSILVGDSNTARPTVKEFDDIEVKSIIELNGDHLHDAKRIIDQIFKNKLVKLDNKRYYFNGRECKVISDDVARRHIGKAMENGLVKVTQNRINSTHSVLQDQIINEGRANPPSLKVYFSDCVFNLTTGEIEQHSIENRNTRSLPVNYAEEYECSEFISWLKSIFSDDLQKIEYLQELIGWTLCRDNLGIEKAILLLGPPRAGKGILLKLIRALHGYGASSFRLGELCDDKMLSSMRDSHIAIDSDSVGPRAFDATAVMGLFKVITSNEPVSIKLLYVQEPLDGPLNCKLCIAANTTPSLHDESQAAANRWLPLIFNESFLGKEDPSLFEKFNSELTGIANWGLIGLLRLLKRKKFNLPKSSIEQIELMTSEGGYLSNFISDQLEFNEKYRCADNDIWNQYRVWAIQEGYELEKRHKMLSAIKNSLRRHGAEWHKSLRIDGADYRGFKGVRLKEPDNDNISLLKLSKAS